MEKEQEESKKSVIAIDKLKIKEEYRDLIPKPAKDDLERLKEDIRENGIRIPIIINEENTILDGHQRFDIAQEYNQREIPCVRMRFNNELEEKRFIIALNFHRRQLNTAQRAELALELKEIESVIAKRRQEATQFIGRGVQKKDVPQPGVDRMVGPKSAPPTEDKGKALDIVAQKVGLSRGIIREVEKIKEAALKNEHISKEWKKALEGKTKIHSVFSKVKRQDAQEEMKNFVVKNDELLRGLERNLRLGNFMEIGKDIGDSSIDLIFTDPPYNNESIRLYEEVAILGKRVLKEGGSLLCYATLQNLPLILDSMGKHMDYWWIIAVRFGKGNPRIGDRRVFSQWKPLLWFVKGKGRRTHEYFGDVIDLGVNEKSLHPWQQPVGEAEYFIRYLTKPGDIVLDPMLGTGTTGVAAIRLKREFIGIEVDAEMHQIALNRIARCIEEENQDKTVNEEETSIIIPEMSFISPEAAVESDSGRMAA